MSEQRLNDASRPCNILARTTPSLGLDCAGRSTIVTASVWLHAGVGCVGARGSICRSEGLLLASHTDSKVAGVQPLPRRLEPARSGGKLSRFEPWLTANKKSGSETS